ncbi:hypothetical protein OB2597_01337 [Pseudooceanicola batsensis HTCC2597]|uniref:Carboxylesterase n=1 Tax=Pseudooceanicola batsensis (strain ATCC BAA-863 / DSM 15984 / KCTC 12145 / HTCC2597) TaxID=252305 RepID=A3U2W0_PSEBH|nr:holin family protein [Pseudooceanicola batsensis]EAQ01490.1 hypothetical protein OB2597_01337 [Pseudooceanicola batsensis HTCC2597]
MGLIGSLFALAFGGGRNAIRETAEIFRKNAENAGERDLDRMAAALEQHAAEFRDRRSAFDIVMDGVNRLPRPMLALGTIGLFVSAMMEPVWFADRMQGLALVPEPLWWLMGAVVSFYFGARHQAKGQQFQREIAAALARRPVLLRDETPGLVVAEAGAEPNAALDDWRRSHAA